MTTFWRYACRDRYGRLLLGQTGMSNVIGDAYTDAEQSFNVQFELLPPEEKRKYMEDWHTATIDISKERLDTPPAVVDQDIFNR